MYASLKILGLYRGYKNRNAQLDKLDQNPPEYLKTSSTVLANQTFSDIGSEDVLHNVYDHLALKHALLDRVIRARKLHHSRFFSINLDYGHQHYLDSLSSQKFIVLRALERLERRTAEVLFEKRKWFKWIRECQDAEEAQRDNERKKVKQEAAMFKRHQKEIQARLKGLIAKETTKRQEAELERAYLERMTEKEFEDKEAEWDPIEAVMEDDRGTYVDLIRHFLFMADTSRPVDQHSTTKDEGASPIANGHSDGIMYNLESNAKPAAKCKKAKKKAETSEVSKPMPDMSLQEDLSQIRQRLKNGVKVSYGEGMHIMGTIDNPITLKDKTAPIPDEEIDKLLEEIAEIKLLLFCRLLLSHATVLPAAIRAHNLEEFLGDKEVTDADLRDLCLKMDSPGLQEIRDACVDLR